MQQILTFMQEYKRLDNLCKQIFQSDRGVSSYIDAMDEAAHLSGYVYHWHDDYRRLKHLRHIRNQLAHDEYSFEQDLIETEDIEWLTNFRQRILEQADPYTLASRAAQPKKQRTTTSHAQKKNRSNAVWSTLLALLLIAAALLLLFWYSSKL